MFTFELALVNTIELELAEIKPALEAAQKAVSNINKKQLNEIKALRKPPKVVEMTLNCVLTLMGIKTKDYKDVQKAVGRKDFIPQILKFNTMKIQERTRKKIQKKYLAEEDFTFERANKASKVAGPLVQWVYAQIKVAHLLDATNVMDVKNAILIVGFTRDCFNGKEIDFLPDEIMNLIFEKISRCARYEIYLQIK